MHFPLIERLNALVRTVVLLAMTATLLYLAVIGIERAMEALCLQFISAISYYFGERAGLQIPGRHGTGKEE